jgi:hypothetical protein
VFHKRVILLDVAYILNKSYIAYFTEITVQKLKDVQTAL